MNYLRPQRPQSLLLAYPPPPKMTIPAGDRLSTIMESGHGSARATPPLAPSLPPLPATPSPTVKDKNQWRRSYHSGKSWSLSSPKGTPPRPSADTMPPPYITKEWRASDYRQPFFVDRQPGLIQRLRTRHGGLGRILLIALLVLLLLIALGVGLGVGLSRRDAKSSSHSNSGDSSSSSSSTTDDVFPLGEYTFVTALRTVSTACTSDSATWTCYPYATYASPNSTTGAALFNWILTATSASPITNSTPPTTDATGVSAGISISSSSDPFTIAIANESLTFVNNDSNPRYTFAFPQTKAVVPTTAITSSGAATECYFNATRVSATIYLSSATQTDYPGAALAGASAVDGGYQAWPYAVVLEQVSGGGAGTPECYATADGAAVGNFTAEAAGDECVCEYANFS